MKIEFRTLIKNNSDTSVEFDEYLNFDSPITSLPTQCDFGCASTWSYNVEKCSQFLHKRREKKGEFFQLIKKKKCFIKISGNVTHVNGKFVLTRSNFHTSLRI